MINNIFPAPTGSVYDRAVRGRTLLAVVMAA